MKPMTDSEIGARQRFLDRMAKEPEFGVKIEGGWEELRSALKASGKDFTITTYAPKHWPTLADQRRQVERALVPWRKP